jgi:hypothetical protein
LVVTEPRDLSLDGLLDLDGQVQPQDHLHRLRTIKAYEYRDAATLLGDFWTMVDAVLREKGVFP